MKAKYFYIIFTLVMMISLSSCLKDDDHYVDFASAGTTVEIPLAAYTPSTSGSFVYKVQAQSYDPAKGATQDLVTVVNIASPKPLGSDLTVTLGVDNAAFDKLNTTLPNRYQILPTTAYTLANNKVTIPAGQRTGTVVFKINLTGFNNATKNYILPVSITDASGQPISMYKTIYYNVRTP